MRPEDLGVSSFRPFQHQTILRLVTSESTASIVNAPTGSGKSLIALGVAKHFVNEGFKVTILTHQKQLQEQYLSYGLDVRTAIGRGNFRCFIEPAVMADDAPCSTCEHSHAFPETNPCEYYKQRDLAIRAGIRVLNYAYFFRSALSDVFPTKILICDEGHRLVNEVLSAASVDFTPRQLSYLPTMPTGQVDERFNAWCSESLEIIRGHLDRLKNLSWGNPELRRWRVLSAKVSHVKHLVDNKLVAVRRDNSIVPCIPEQILPRLFRSLGLRRVILLSATMWDKDYWADRLGLKEVEYLEVPSTFPVQNRPVYVRPVARLNVRTTKDPDVLDNLVKAIDAIVSSRWPQKGLVHCSSFQLGREIYERSRLKRCMFLHEPGKPRLEAFKAAEAGFYISPSATEGLDLKDDLCRVSVVAKLSWPNLGDPVTKIQSERIPGLGEYEAASALVQATGRGMRHDRDYCESYILDGSFYFLWQKTKDKLPGWFKEALVW